ncbi:MAG: DUF502 domain-containing protein [Candidatus Mycalebacterium zealandia]|nr:MAG: DUF502 domain-containing protein [Candidatus Mycalebacterium zealandia]
MSFFNSIRNAFLTGLAVIVPFGLALFFVYVISGWLYSLVSAVPSMALQHWFPAMHFPAGVVKLISFSIGISGTVIFVLVAGYVVRNILGNRLVSFIESIILSIPVIRTVYNASKQILNTLLGHSHQKGKGVVMFEYPKKDIYSIGFVMGRMKPGEAHNVLDETLVNIFVPTTPNPTSGFYLMVPESKVREIPLSVEQAFNVIISGGLSSSSKE